MNIIEINKVIDVLSDNLNIPKSEINVKSYNSVLIFFIDNKEINYEDICYDVNSKFMDEITFNNIINLLGDKALLLSHSAIDMIGIKLEPLYMENQIIEKVSKVLISSNSLDNYSTVKEIRDSIISLIEIIDNDDRFTNSVDMLKKIEKIIYNKILNSNFIFGNIERYEFNKKVKTPDEYYIIESSLVELINKLMFTILSDNLSKEFIIVV